MRSRKENVQKIEEALKAGRRSRRKAFEVSPDWQHHVMRHIRLLDTEKIAPIDPLSFTDHLIWRFALLMCLVTGMFFIYSLFSAPGFEYQMAELFMDDPAGFTLAHSFGL